MQLLHPSPQRKAQKVGLGTIKLRPNVMGVGTSHQPMIRSGKFIRVMLAAFINLTITVVILVVVADLNRTTTAIEIF